MRALVRRVLEKYGIYDEDGLQGYIWEFIGYRGLTKRALHLSCPVCLTPGRLFRLWIDQYTCSNDPISLDMAMIRKIQIISPPSPHLPRTCYLADCYAVVGYAMRALDYIAFTNSRFFDIVRAQRMRELTAFFKNRYAVLSREEQEYCKSVMCGKSVGPPITPFINTPTLRQYNNLVANAPPIIPHRVHFQIHHASGDWVLKGGFVVRIDEKAIYFEDLRIAMAAHDM